MDLNTTTKIYKDVSFLIQKSITISVLCQRIYYHMLSFYGNELDVSYNKAEKIANVVEIELKYLEKILYMLKKNIILLLNNV